ncbi:hypothetical protein Vafri_6580, partial [Volvox africanus]
PATGLSATAATSCEPGLNSVTVVTTAASVVDCGNSSNALQPKVSAPSGSRPVSATALLRQVPDVESRPTSIATPPRCSRPGSVTTAQCLASGSEWEAVSGASELESDPRSASVDASRPQCGSRVPVPAALQPQLLNPGSRLASPAAPQQPQTGSRVGSDALPKAQTQNANSRPSSASTSEPQSASRSASRPRSGFITAFPGTPSKSFTAICSRPESATAQTQSAYSGTGPVSASVPSSLKEAPLRADSSRERLLVAAGGPAAFDQPVPEGASSAEESALARAFDCSRQDAEWPVDSKVAVDQEQPAVQLVKDPELVTEGTAVVLVATQAEDLGRDRVTAGDSDVADAVADLKSELPSLNTLEMEVGLGNGGRNAVCREGRTRTSDDVVGGVELVQAFLTEMMEKEAKGKADDPA